MKLIDRMLLKQFIPIFLATWFLLSILINITDLFINITRYIERAVDIQEILRVQLLFFPRCMTLSIAVALLFSVTFTLGSLYARNELIAVLAMGMPLPRFTASLLILSLLLSISFFVFEDQVVIPNFREKESLSYELQGISSPVNTRSSTLLDKNAQHVISVNRFDSQRNIIYRPFLLIRDESSVLQYRIQASEAQWNGDTWEFMQADVYDFTENREVVHEKYSKYIFPEFTTDPSRFFSKFRNINYMTIEDAGSWIDELKIAGLPFREAETQYHERYSNSFAPFIIVLISTAFGSTLKKNVLIVSLLVSLAISVVYYGVRLVGVSLAEASILSPFFWSMALNICIHCCRYGLIPTSKTLAF
jgi:lipopolysaccharide export system permease protein